MFRPGSSRCGPVTAATTTLLLTAHPGAAAPLALELVETAPVETTLENADLPDAHEVWLDMIAASTERIDLAHFYASNHPQSRLETVIVALEDAAERGVDVRFLAEEKFYDTYPETLDRLSRRPGIEVRRYDVGQVMGGVLHAKVMLVDGSEAFVGSQNFDWRALTHIQELGLRIRMPAVVRALEDVFATDWAIAGGADPSYRAPVPVGGYRFPATGLVENDSVRVTPVASPQGWLPDEGLWDLPRLVALVDGAQTSVRVQLLTYRPVGRDGTYFDVLESALRRAAARGVEVQLLVADWSKRAGTIEGLQSLHTLPQVTVKMISVPEASSGFIPYARVIHAKYLVTDASHFWLGTSNWEKDYFYSSRNVGLIVESPSLARRIDAFFEKGWTSSYAYEVDPCATYTPPRRGR